MKALIQRVTNAKVAVNDEVISTIGKGFCILVGISSNDTKKDMEYLVRKILSIKLFDDDDENGKKWNNTVVDKDYEILCVSQFTLYNTWKGTRPDFHLAMPGEKSREFYEEFLELLKKAYKPEKIKKGVFGSYMQVSIQNDGPTTFEIESPSKPSKEVKTKEVKQKKENTNNTQNLNLDDS